MSVLSENPKVQENCLYGVAIWHISQKLPISSFKKKKIFKKHFEEKTLLLIWPLSASVLFFKNT